MDCCSMASWMEVRSESFILSNSSMRHTPRSASTSAPPSSVHSPVMGSLCTAAVRPTADAPLPVVYTARGAVFSTYFRNCDLATPGSPSISTLMSPRTRCFMLMFFSQPPNMASASASFTWSWPYTEGAMERRTRCSTRGLRAMSRMARSSSAVGAAADDASFLAAT